LSHGNGNIREFHDGAIGELDFFNTSIIAGEDIGCERNNVGELSQNSDRVPRKPA